MKVLLTVEFYYPSIGGSQEVVKQIAEYLVKKGHQVTVATSSDKERTQFIQQGVKIVDFPISGNQVKGYSGNVEEYRNFLLEADFDLMMNYAAQNWSADLVFPLLDRLNCKKVLAPCGFSMLHRPNYQDFFLKMPENLKKYDHLIFHSDRYQDIDYARKHAIRHYSVIPNGAGSEFEVMQPSFRKKYGIADKSPLFLTVGNHTGLKGHRLVILAFLKACVDNATLVIIGELSEGRCARECRILSILVPISKGGKKRILLLNPARSDVVAAYQSADLFLFGSQIEASPLVLFEAMASKTPFITTGCGNAEEIIEWGNSGILIPTTRRENGLLDARTEDMAKAIEELWQDPDRRNRMALNGYQAWSERFTWEKITKEYETLFQRIIAKGNM